MSKHPKDYIVTIEGFLNSIQNVDHLNTRLKYKQIEYILFLNLNEGHNGLCFILTDGFSNYWLKQYEYQDFEKIRHKLGMEGTYDGYFEILKDSILNNNAISLEIEKEEANLLVKYQISKGVTLNGQFGLGEAIRWDKNPSTFRKINQNFLFDLQRTMEIDTKRSEKMIKELNETAQSFQKDDKNKKINEMPSLSFTGVVGNFPNKEPLKQKAKTDLINPCRKKVKGKGAKFGAENVNLTGFKEENGGY